MSSLARSKCKWEEWTWQSTSLKNASPFRGLSINVSFADSSSRRNTFTLSWVRERWEIFGTRPRLILTHSWINPQVLILRKIISIIRWKTNLRINNTTEHTLFLQQSMLGNSLTWNEMKRSNISSDLPCIRSISLPSEGVEVPQYLLCRWDEEAKRYWGQADANIHCIPERMTNDE